ncbi:hypothetical protein glysoja_045295 [Glycine soja]|uniref:Uncharacterized protein n=1 Tax=Glycine soja TaxID=3848 RepID=A0A0B2NWV7_GLYSO|nr:hypothetical protein glysoja_045295 [Glycine soja]
MTFSLPSCAVEMMHTGITHYDLDRFVVDENSANKSVKPRKWTKRLPGDILVRQYGSYA